jgi:two-component SAPR family response regulator
VNKDSKDSIIKKLFEDKEVFASFINGVIYQGKKILSSHHLKEINLSTISDSWM